MSKPTIMFPPHYLTIMEVVCNQTHLLMESRQHLCRAVSRLEMNDKELFKAILHEDVVEKIGLLHQLILTSETAYAKTNPMRLGTSSPARFILQELTKGFTNLQESTGSLLRRVAAHVPLLLVTFNDADEVPELVKRGISLRDVIDCLGMHTEYQPISNQLCDAYTQRGAQLTTMLSYTMVLTNRSDPKPEHGILVRYETPMPLNDKESRQYFTDLLQGGQLRNAWFPCQLVPLDAPRPYLSPNGVKTDDLLTQLSESLSFKEWVNLGASDLGTLAEGLKTLSSMNHKQTTSAALLLLAAPAAVRESVLATLDYQKQQGMGLTKEQEIMVANVRETQTPMKLSEEEQVELTQKLWNQLNYNGGVAPADTYRRVEDEDLAELAQVFHRLPLDKPHMIENAIAFLEAAAEDVQVMVSRRYTTLGQLTDGQKWVQRQFKER